MERCERIGEFGALYWKDAVNIAIQICQAIEHAHKIMLFTEI